MIHKNNFEQHFCFHRRIVVPKEKRSKIKDFIDELLLYKTKYDDSYKIDNKNKHNRWYTGLLGEAAIEELLGMEIINYTIGNSKKFHKSDLSPIGLNIGIKTSLHGNFPLVLKKPKTPEIITTKLDNKTIAICGYATKEILKKYSNTKFVMDYRITRRKTAFFGYNYLRRFNNYDDLKKLYNEEFNATNK